MNEYTVIDGQYNEPSELQKFGANRPGRVHQGIDLAIGKSEKCRAVKNGKIKKRAYNSQAGYSFWVDYTDGTKGLYVHVTKESYDALSDGKLVRAGDYLAMSGNT